MRKTKKAVVDERLCVGCGCCIKVCPRGAIHVPAGICAVVEEEICVGCGLCAKTCPASVITIEPKEVPEHEE